MNVLEPEDLQLLDAAREGYEPTDVDRARNRHALFARIGVGVGAAAAGAATVTAASTASASVAAGSGVTGGSVATSGVAASAAAGGSVAISGVAASAAAGGSVATTGIAGGGVIAANAGGVTSVLVKALVALTLVGGVAAGTVTAVRAPRVLSSTASPTNVSGAQPTAATTIAGVVKVASPLAAEASAAPATQDPAAVSPPDLLHPADVVRAPLSPPNARALPQAHRAATSGVAANAGVSVSSTVAPSSALDGETQLLRDADARLRAGDGEAALALLDAHEARFPNAILREEREGERVLALCSLGRVAEARARASRFLATSPRSPVAPRIRSSCAGDGSTR